MNTSTSKTIIVVIVIAVIGIFIYLGMGSKNETDTLTTVDFTTDRSMIGNDIKILLSQLNSLKIDSEIFTNPVYKSLNDYTNTIPPLTQGKKNPFAPFPGTTLKPSKTQ